jgi:flavodoxin I
MTESLVVYDSVFGNTAKIAKAIGDAVDAPVKKVTEVNPADMENLKVLFVGSPTRAFNPTPAIKNFLKGLQRDALVNVKAAAFDTRIAPEDIDSDFFRTFVQKMGYADKKIAKQLVKKGADLALESAGFAVKDSEGPLKEGELERARTWAKAIL